MEKLKELLNECRQMKKLKELLNEWSKTAIENKCNWTDVYDEEGVYFLNLFDRDMTMEIEDVISKRNGFIKWLVENEKIDIKALVVKGEMRSGWDFENKKGNEESGEEIWNKYYSELCLMILAIQDEPIEFLVSILK